ncbi:MAG: DUF4012 domain-containing protein [Ktedonobacteraceae bacterium]
MRVENSPNVTDRKRDISSWQVGDISRLSTREKKRYNQRKAAIKAYFTTNATLDELSQRYRLSKSVLRLMVEKCLDLHEDGSPWGFRALLPGVSVVDSAPQPAVETVADTTPEELDTHQTPASGDASKQDAVEVEQSNVLLEDVTSDEVVDTGKREAIHMPVVPTAPPDFAQVVPETPQPTLVPDVVEEETELPEEEEKTTTLQQVVESKEETELPEEEEKTTTLQLLAASDEAITAETEPEVIDALEENVEEQPVTETPATSAVPPVPPIEDETATSESEDAISAAERILAQEDESVGEDSEVGQLLPLAPMAVSTEVSFAPLLPTPHTPTRTYPVSKTAVQRRYVRKHWSREVHGHKKQRRLVQIVSLSIVAAILLFVLVPVGAGFAAYGAYNNISGIAHDGINHLLKVKGLLPISKSDPTAALNATKLQQAQVEFNAAESDFTQLQQLVNRPDVQAAITQFAPQYATKLGMAQSLVQVALDVSRMGNELCGVALIGANILHGSPLSSGSTKPVVSVADISAVEGAMVHALYYINDIWGQMSQVSINDIPISSSQKAQLASLMALLPQAESMITQAQDWVGLVSWLLGVGQQRRFLIQTMDRAELRPGGGFTGQYGILQIQDGRMSPLSLTDVTLLDYAENGTAIGRTAPPAYKWMNFGNWGVRDSNLSGDFPTTARMTMQLYSDEGGGPVDGDIAFTPTLIAHILNVVGPIKVPGYNETITAQNLEDRLHYYQQDQSAIAREKQISGNFTHAGRKAFTSTLGKMLLDKVRHVPVKELLAIVKNAIKDIQSRDLEIYFNDPAAESWLLDHGYGGSLDTFSKQDGFVVVQANISISKASQYVHTTEQDQVTLDAQGGATHNLTITLDYQQKGPVYGFDTYADYMRIYAPPGAQFQGGDGFDTGQPLCKPSVSKVPPTNSGTPTSSGTQGSAGCSQYNSSFGNARYCPNGNYSLGVRLLNTPWVVDSLGAPTALTSDLPGRSMWGGLTETPKNCISTITTSWYVPHAVKKVHGQPTYSILIQKQGGYSPTIQLSIDASAVKGLKSFTFNGDINSDRMFTITGATKKK